MALIPEAWLRIAGESDLDVLPRRLTKKTAASVVTQHKFPVTPRGLQDWPDVDWIVVNGKATCATDELLAAADRRLAEGRRRSAVTIAEPPSTRPSHEQAAVPAARARRREPAPRAAGKRRASALTPAA